MKAISGLFAGLQQAPVVVRPLIVFVKLYAVKYSARCVAVSTGLTEALEYPQ